MSDSIESKHRAHWRATTRLTAALLLVWVVAGPLLSIVFADKISHLSLGGIPLGFWFAQQGSIIVFVVLIFVYAIGMKHIDRKFHV